MDGDKLLEPLGFTYRQLAVIYLGSSVLFVIGTTITWGLGGFFTGLGICGGVYAVRGSMNAAD